VAINRVVTVRGPVEKLGGRIDRFWVSFGDYDTVAIVDMPDSVSAAPFSMAISAGGACKSVKTTPLLTAQEGQEAMKRAGACGYQSVTRTRKAGA
jgi:uncharacterized protein with GYD domain